MSEKPNVIIIGAGIIGCAIAFELGKRGYKTLNIDKLPTAGFGSTSNSCALVRAHYSTWDGVAMAYENFKYWEDWPNYLETEDERGLAKYLQIGSYIICTEARDMVSTLPIFDEVGVKYEEWDLETAKEKFPLADLHTHYPVRRPEDPAFWEESTEPILGVVFTPESGYVNDPQLATHNLMRAAEAKGGKFMFNVEVTAVRQKDGRVTGVTLADGTELNAPIVINVAGPHSFVINRMAGVEEEMNIKTRALKHLVALVPAPDGFDFEKDGYHVSDVDIGAYGRPETGNRVLIGSEDPPCDTQEWIEDPDNYDRTLDEAQFKAQVLRMAKRIPSLPVPDNPQGLVDLYDVSDDWMPIYDKSALPGFYMAIGTSGNQFKNAGGVGHMLAEIIEAVEAGHDQDSDPLQVKMPYTGVVLNTGFYSRLREINRDSSFSVLG